MARTVLKVGMSGGMLPQKVLEIYDLRLFLVASETTYTNIIILSHCTIIMY